VPTNTSRPDPASEGSTAPLIGDGGALRLRATINADAYAKPIEFEKGKSAIAVPSREKLPALIEQLIAAVNADELDELLARAAKPVGGSKPARRAA